MKYVLRKDLSIQYDGRTLYRIEYCDGKNLGGYLESENNLSQENNCRVLDNTRVYGNARVCGNACVYGDAWVYGNAHVYGDNIVSNYRESINVTNLPFNLTITKNHTRIGCVQKLHDEWFNIKEDEVVKLGLDVKHFSMYLTLLKTLIGYVVNNNDIKK